MHTCHVMQAAFRARITGADFYHPPCGSQISNLDSQTWVQTSFLHSINVKDQSQHNNIDSVSGILIKVCTG